MDVIGIFGAIASVFGAIIAVRQKRLAEKAKKSSEAARDATLAAKNSFFQNLQYESFTKFKKECDKFCETLRLASIGKKSEGRDKDYLENELEKFVTKLNDAMTNSSGETRTKLESFYRKLQADRTKINSDYKDNVIAVLDDMRELTRFIADVQINNKLTV